MKLSISNLVSDERSKLEHLLNLYKQGNVGDTQSLNFANLGVYLENRDNRMKFEQFIEVIKENEASSNKNKEIVQK